MYPFKSKCDKSILFSINANQLYVHQWSNFEDSLLFFHRPIYYCRNFFKQILLGFTVYYSKSKNDKSTFSRPLLKGKFYSSQTFF